MQVQFYFPFWREESRVMASPYSLSVCVCVPLSVFEPVGRWVLSSDRMPCNRPSKKLAWSRQQVACLTLVSCLAYSSVLKMEVTCSTETSVDFQRTTWCNNPEDTIPHNHRCKNLKSYSRSLFTKLSRSVVPLEVTPVPYFLISYNQ
jgi:hypothetical protein